MTKLCVEGLYMSASGVRVCDTVACDRVWCDKVV